MQLKRQSVEARQNERHYLKENTSENKIPRPEIFKSVDHEGQVRSGYNICRLCNFLAELSSSRVTKTAISHRVFFLNLV